MYTIGSRNYEVVDSLNVVQFNELSRHFGKLDLKPIFAMFSAIMDAVKDGDDGFLKAVLNNGNLAVSVQGVLQTIPEQDTIQNIISVILKPAGESPKFKTKQEYLDSLIQIRDDLNWAPIGDVAPLVVEALKKNPLTSAIIHQFFQAETENQ